MLLALLAFMLQLMLAPPAAGQGAASPPGVRVGGPDEDSLKDVGRAHDAQAGFERGRRYLLPWAMGRGGYCDVKVGRFCWWYDDGAVPRAAEPEEVSRRRESLLAELDALGRRRPADPWIAGMRVYYRIDNRRPALADSAARECAASAWWCSALRAYAAHARNNAAAADSGFAAALGAMPDSTRCAWLDIATLLPAGTRGRYEQLGCTEREAIESRYWLLARPRLSAPANEWRNEFLARRVVAVLLADAVSPHRIPWGKDTEELLLRYGWPVAWSRIQPASLTTLEPKILGHDPAPSFHFGPGEELLDSDDAADDVAWRPAALRAESRFAHPSIRRMAELRATTFAFRRGDSTLIAAAWEPPPDDTLANPVMTIGAVLADGSTRSDTVASVARGFQRLMVGGRPALAGVEFADSASGTFAFSRTRFPARPDSSPTSLSALLLFRATDEIAPQLDAALANAIAGHVASLAEPLGVYWESYGTDSASLDVETSVFVERIDGGVFRSIRQRLGLADPDSPLVVRWNESRPGTVGVATRALALDLSRLPAGRYRVTVGVTPAVGAGATASREVELR